MEWCGPCLGYLHTARLVALLRWDLAKGILAWVDPLGAQGQRGRLSSLYYWWSPEGGALQHQEGDRPVGGMDPQKHSVAHLCGASKFSDGNWFSLEFWLENGRGKWRWLVPLFPHQAKLCLHGLNNSRAVDF